MKILCILITSLLVVACLPFFDEPPRISGVFKTDQEMSEYLINNYDYFNEASELSRECNEGIKLEGEKEGLENDLGLVNISCEIYPWPNLLNEIRLVVYHQKDRNDGARYIKGYLYSENPYYKAGIWNTNLDKIPNTRSCDYYHRHIKVSNEEYYDNWYIFSAINCED